jgi:hypothetical protein
VIKKGIEQSKLISNGREVLKRDATDKLAKIRSEAIKNNRGFHIVYRHGG